MSRRIKRRGVLGSVVRTPRRRLFAVQRTQWNVLRWLEEQEREEQAEAAIKVADDADFTFE